MGNTGKTGAAGSIIPRWLSAAWAYVQDTWVAFRPTRFSAIGVFLVFAVLGFAGQGQDFLIRVGTDPVFARPAVGLLSFSTLFAFVAWYCARAGVKVRYERIPGEAGENQTEEDALAAQRAANPAGGHAHDPVSYARKRARWIVGLRIYLPRFLGTLAFVAVGVPVWWAHERAVTLNDPETAANLVGVLIALAVLGVLASLYFWVRRPLARAAEDRGLLIVARVLGATEHARDDLAKADDRVLRKSPMLIILSILLLAFLILGAIDPVGLGFFAGSVPVFFLIVSAVVSVGTVLVIVTRRYNLPVFLAVFIVLFLVSGYFNNHQIRLWPADTASESGDPFVAKRPSPAEAFKEWLEAYDLERESTEPAKPSVPLFIVASAGGGSRAAYWTVTALGHIQDKYPAFADHMFMLSGVSGGALGSAVFAALVSCDRDPDCTFSPDLPQGMGPFEGTGTRMLGQDFLAAPLAAMVTRDVTPFLFDADRGAALEQAWEQAWRDAFDGNDDRFGWPLQRLWPEDRPWPAVLLNGTIVETGARVITSNLDLEKTVSMEDVTDALAVSGHDMRISTAANNSARFPIVGPASTLAAPIRDSKTQTLRVASDTCLPENRPQPVEGEFRIVDGGYFENFGATTALEILKEIRTYLDCKDQADSVEYDVLPVVIQISSDPDFEPTATLTTEPLSPMPQIRAPLAASLKTRNAHGGIAMAALWQYAVVEQDWRYFHLRMCSNRDKVEDPRRKPADPPLGWFLSDQSENEIRGYLANGKDDCNTETLAELFQLLDETLGPLKAKAEPGS
jgi:hypothetical protein